jgi:2-dehydro-3-deoxy-D-pentonate aldolase
VITTLPTAAPARASNLVPIVPPARAALRGIVPPLVTPLRGHDELDVAGIERLLEHTLAGGVHGLFILGTSGEGTGLSYRLRKEVVERVCRQVRGRVPILVGITDTSFVEAVSMAHFAANAGATAVVTAGPYYLPVVQSELVRYIEHLGREVPVPLFIYNMPQLTKVHFAPETLRALTQVGKSGGTQGQFGRHGLFRSTVALKRTGPTGPCWWGRNICCWMRCGGAAMAA